METIQITCYIKKHRYFDHNLRTYYEYYYAHSCMRYGDNFLFTVTNVGNHKGILSGLWECVRKLKKQVEIELFLILSDDDDIQELTSVLKEYFESSRVILSALLLKDQSSKLNGLQNAIEKVIYDQNMFDFDKLGLTGTRYIRPKRDIIFPGKIEIISCIDFLKSYMLSLIKKENDTTVCSTSIEQKDEIKYFSSVLQIFDGANPPPIELQAVSSSQKV